jgi:hypothetical protein
MLSAAISVEQRAPTQAKPHARVRAGAAEAWQFALGSALAGMIRVKKASFMLKPVDAAVRQAISDDRFGPPERAPAGDPNGDD